jgi:hypothetical protein
MPFAIPVENQYCPICRRKTSKKMQPDAQNDCSPGAAACPASLLIEQVIGLGDSFAVY